LTASNLVAVTEPLPAFEEDTAAETRPSPVTSVVLSDGSMASEQLRLLASRVRAQSREKRLRTIGVVSATPAEGKTTLAIGLARALGSGGRDRVLLIEADLRRPTLDKTLGLPPNPAGVLKHLDGGMHALTIRKLADSAGCWVLSAGAGTFRHPEALASPRMTMLLEAAARSFDYVVLDCPPLLTVADAVLLQDYVDRFVLVVRARHAPREAVQRAVSLLKPGSILGTVLNDHREIIQSYYYPSYT
jgi:capsular exopolysaccharide synthesis family protein